MSEIDLGRLREVAEAATPGPWQEIGSDWSDDGVMLSGYVFALTGDTSIGEDVTGDGVPAPDAAHIATFDPPTVLTLLDRLERAEAAVERVRALHTQGDTFLAPGAWCPADGDGVPCRTIQALSAVSVEEQR